MEKDERITSQLTDRNSQSILLVEDSPEDYDATRRGLKRAGLINPLYRVSDGDEALDFLYHREKYSDPESAPRPGLILLDLNMPGTDGREVLQIIKDDENLAAIPVVILTTSSDERDIQSCYAIGANSYIQKPVELGSFMDAIKRLKNYWFELTILPKPGNIGK